MRVRITKLTGTTDREDFTWLEETIIQKEWAFNGNNGRWQPITCVFKLEKFFTNSIELQLLCSVMSLVHGGYRAMAPSLNFVHEFMSLFSSRDGVGFRFQPDVRKHNYANAIIICREWRGHGLSSYLDDWQETPVTIVCTPDRSDDVKIIGLITFTSEPTVTVSRKSAGWWGCKKGALDCPALSLRPSRS